jgi:hypothetical protein
LEISMTKFIAALLGALALAGAAQADSFSNEDAACTGTCQVHDSATLEKMSGAGKASVRDSQPTRQARREPAATRRVARPAHLTEVHAGRHVEQSAQ